MCSVLTSRVGGPLDGRDLDLAARIPAKERFSRVYRGRGEPIDHLLISHALLDQIERVRTIGEGQLASIDYDPTSRRLAEDYDHALVIAHLQSDRPPRAGKQGV